MPLVAKIKDIKPNPFRHLDRYPINRDKVESLRESMRSTTYWGNLVVRVTPDGVIEQAFGHHRKIAMLEEFGPDAEVELIERDLSDDAMLQIMARENMAEWATTASVEHETIRAAVQAFADRRIHLPSPAALSNKSDWRYAPSFATRLPARDGGLAYTPQSLAEFIGWVRSDGKAQEKVTYGLGALELIEEGILDEAAFAELSTRQAQALVIETKKAKERREVDARIKAREAEAARKRQEEAAKRAAEAKKAAEERAAAAARAKEAKEKADRDRRVREVEEREAREAAAKAKQAEEAERQRKKAEEAKAAAAEAAERAKVAEAEHSEAAAAEVLKRDEEKAEREDEQRAKRAADSFTASAVKHRAEGREAASRVGRHVGTTLRAGKAGYRQAAEVAQQVDVRPSSPKPPPHFEQFMTKLMTDILKIMADEDPRSVKLVEAIKFKSHLYETTRKGAAVNLRTVARRFEHFASQIEKD